MNADAISKKEIVNAIMEKTCYSEDVVRKAIDAFINVVVEGTSAGSKVKIRNLGTFYPYDTKPRAIYNPNSESIIRSEGRRTVNFRLSPAFQKKLEESSETFI